MPPFEYRPNVNPYVENIGALMLRGPEGQARAAEQRGALQAQTAQSIAGTITGTIGDAIRYREDAPRRQLQALQVNAATQSAQDDQAFRSAWQQTGGDPAKMRVVLGQQRALTPAHDQALQQLDAQQQATKAGALADFGFQLHQTDPGSPDDVKRVVDGAAARGMFTPDDAATMFKQLTTGTPAQYQRAAFTFMAGSPKYTGFLQDLAKPVTTAEGAITSVRQPDGTFTPLVTNPKPTTPKTQAELAADAANPNSPTQQQSSTALDLMRPPTPPTRTSLESKPVLLDGKPALVNFNPATGAHSLPTGEDVSARVKPMPPASAVNVSGIGKLYSDTDPKAIAAQIRLGAMPPDIGQYGRPVQGAIASELAKRGPNGEAPYDLASAQRTWKAQINLNRTMNGSQQVRLDESIRSGLAMYDKVDAIADRWDGLGIGALSRANLASAKEGYQGPAAQKVANELEGQIGQLTSDIATIEQGGLTPTNEARGVAEKSLQAWWGKGTIRAMTEQGRANMRIRETARAQQEPMVPGNTSQGAAPPATAPALPPVPPGMVRAFDQNGNAHDGKPGTPLPAGWRLAP